MINQKVTKPIILKGVMSALGVAISVECGQPTMNIKIGTFAGPKWSALDV